MVFFVFFFFKQKTAYEIRKGDWSSDVCSSDLVYASGGENGLHTHPNEDHTFIVLQGSARYYDADGGHTDVGKHEGIMLPAGAYYWFEATSKEPLVLVRIGCRVGSQDASGRVNIRGEAMPGDSKENKRVPVVVRDGEFFE